MCGVQILDSAREGEKGLGWFSQFIISWYSDVTYLIRHTEHQKEELGYLLTVIGGYGGEAKENGGE